MIKTRLRTIVRDRGWKKFKARNTKLAQAKPGVTVGVHGDAEGGYDNGKSVVEIANIHEFGLGPPQRSFVRAWVEEKRDEISKVQITYARLVSLGKLEQQTALDRMGLLFVASMQKRIAGGVPPPNADSTIARKGSSTPLIDEGILRASIKHKVDE